MNSIRLCSELKSISHMRLCAFQFMVQKKIKLILRSLDMCLTENEEKKFQGTVGGSGLPPKNGIFAYFPPFQGVALSPQLYPRIIFSSFSVRYMSRDLKISLIFFSEPKTGKHTASYVISTLIHYIGRMNSYTKILMGYRQS